MGKAAYKNLLLRLHTVREYTILGALNHVHVDVLGSINLDIIIVITLTSKTVYSFRDANCSFFAVFSTFFKLQILVILSKMPQNTFFSKDHFVYTSMETK